VNIAEKLILREYQRSRLVLCDYRVMGGWTADVLSMTVSGYADEYCIAEAHADLSILTMRTKDHLKVQPCRIWAVFDQGTWTKSKPGQTAKATLIPHLPGVGIMVYDNGAFRVVKKPVRVHLRHFLTSGNTQQIIMALNNRAHDEFLARHMLSIKARTTNHVISNKYLQ
jgi:hypothetical protein